jgi:hypothetical protein
MRAGDKKLLVLALVFVVSIALTVAALYMAATSLRQALPKGSMGQNVSQVNVRQANGIGKVHAAKPQMKETYCGRALNEEEWLTTSKEVTCIGCTRAGAPTRPERPGRGS